MSEDRLVEILVNLIVIFATLIIIGVFILLEYLDKLP